MGGRLLQRGAVRRRREGGAFPQHLPEAAVSRRLVGGIDRLPEQEGAGRRRWGPWREREGGGLARHGAGHACTSARRPKRQGPSPPPSPSQAPHLQPLGFTCRYHRDAAASSLGTPLPLRRTVARRLIARPSPPSAARRTQSTASERSGASARCLPPPPATSSRVLTRRLQAVACGSTRRDWRYWQCGEPGVFVE